jgi:hypothetical protein
MGLEGDAARAYVQTCILEKSDDAHLGRMFGLFRGERRVRNRELLLALRDGPHRRVGRVHRLPL